MKLRFLSILLSALIAGSCFDTSHYVPEEGISRDLAEYRKSVISNITYRLNFQIPEDPEKQVTGEVKLSFMLSGLSREIPIDFQADSAQVLEVLKRGSEKVDFHFTNGHIVIPRRYLQLDNNNFTIRFKAGNLALNRNEDFMYTLFVPNKASTVFPCFDQPNLKARFKLSLTIPQKWTAVANAQVINRAGKGPQKQVDFAYSGFIPTYLFSFAAGEFQKITHTRKGRDLVLYHKHGNEEEVNRNKAAIFRLVHQSLQFMEDYTGIAYPFQKYALLAIPSFQYSGMEHPGATLYRAEKLFLSKEATFNQRLDRADLIAHEVAHNWFGNYLTIEWFNEVWLKELFATFMADKMTRRYFPDARHDLMFFLSHIPPAFALDRTAGAMPVSRNLENLNGAGNLYDAIIYNKSPVIMNQLEMLIGKNDMQHGLKQYLKQHAHSNATWNDLIRILSPFTDIHLKKWSDQWMLQKGMPRITTQVNTDGKGHLLAVRLQQQDMRGENSIWQQSLQTCFCYMPGNRYIEVFTHSPVTKLPKARGLENPKVILPDVSGKGYGYFALREADKQFLTRQLYTIKKDLLRAVAWVTLYEDMLRQNFAPGKFAQLALEAISKEQNEMLLRQVLDYLETVYWQFLPHDRRKAFFQELEPRLWQRILNEENPSQQANLTKKYISFASNSQASKKLIKLYQDTYDFYAAGKSEKTDILLQLMLLNAPRADELLQKRLKTLNDKHEKEKLQFILPALSNTQAERDSFFYQLRKAENRAHEQWVVKGLHYLHHPLNEADGIQYLQEALQLLPDVVKTGNVFFTEDWLDANFAWYNSARAVTIIDNYLIKSNIPEILKNKIRQQADLLKRAHSMKSNQQ